MGVCRFCADNLMNAASVFGGPLDLSERAVHSGALLEFAVRRNIGDRSGGR